ncbi:alpha/beta hydrolase [Geojedonia litorea]|uniref:Alpha/beta hydrolase n=2 Tax=Geojedonia litorea TaxID=1268269 RepID=A0ABV9N0I2_9FLAO
MLLLVLLLNIMLAMGQATVIKNIDYLDAVDYGDNKDKLDIYMPANAKEVPVIVYFHGGRLLDGNKDWAAPIAPEIVKAGIGLVSANYRLSPEVQHPAHVKDAAAATAWVLKHIAHYGGDPKKVYVGGHSAGGYLAALLALDFTYLQDHDLEDTLAGAVIISPFLYVEETAKDRIEWKPVFKTIWGTDPEDWLKASVSPHIKPNRNNFLLIYGDADLEWRKLQVQRFAQAMKTEVNENIQMFEIPDRTHTSLVYRFEKEEELIIRLIKNFVLNEN